MVSPSIFPCFMLILNSNPIHFHALMDVVINHTQTKIDPSINLTFNAHPSLFALKFLSIIFETFSRGFCYEEACTIIIQNANKTICYGSTMDLYNECVVRGAEMIRSISVRAKGPKSVFIFGPVESFRFSERDDTIAIKMSSLANCVLFLLCEDILNAMNIQSRNILEICPPYTQKMFFSDYPGIKKTWRKDILFPTKKELKKIIKINH